MCGIYGTINKAIDLDRIREHLYHRGPDAQTSWTKDNVQLHHFRLSILDHEGGVQPMLRNNNITIFNGELYNHLEVRKKFDLECKSNSDTETLLAAYEKLGPNCLKEFDGMFAFAIYDIEKKELFLARDRAGKKPLYIYQLGKEIVFASELNALSKTILLKPDIDHLDQFFKGAFIGSDTAYQNVSELNGGEYAIINTNTSTISRSKWWSIRENYNTRSNDDYATAEGKVKQILTSAVKRRIDSSDLEVGAFLSGGIDSGLVVAAASRHYSKLKTFTVAMPGAYNESPLAKLVADQYETDHTVIDINFDNLKADFKSIILNYGEPYFDSSAIPSYYVAREAKKHVTVALNGDGADELFAGYRRYVPAKYIDFYKQRSNKAWSVIKSTLPLAHEKKSLYNYLYRLINTMGMTGSDAYWAVTMDIFQDNPDAYRSKDKNEKFINSIISANVDWDPLHKQMALDFHILLEGILLKKMDIATMAHSLEGRSPFLCKEFLDYIPTLPPNYKVKGKTPKYILRQIAKQWLPIELFTQPKRGFEIPLKNWINDQLSEFIQDYLNVANPFVSQFIEDSFIKKLITNNVNTSAEKRAKMLYQLLVTEMWAKENNFV